MRPVLRRGDGRYTPHLRPAVLELQEQLESRGLIPDFGVTGMFGGGTDRAVRRFQEAQGLVDDGIVGPLTWGALIVDESPPHERVAGLETFHGDLDWIHAWEGHAGRPYWPGGSSGVTLDPGFDLAHQDLETLESLYPARITFGNAAGVVALRGAFGLKGREAKAYVREHPELREISVSRPEAARAMPLIAVRYWQPIGGRFARLRDSATPGSVQTALLSLAYNRGARNRGLEVLEEPLERGRWLAVADRIALMQQDHELPGVRRRRREEAELIRSEVAIAA